MQQLQVQCTAKNAVPSKQIIQFGKAEVKILCVICYYVSVGIFVILPLTYFEATNATQLKAITEYLECQLPGIYTNEIENDCGNSDIPTVRLRPFYVLSVIGVLQAALIPAVILAYTWKCSCKKSCKIKQHTMTEQAKISSGNSGNTVILQP